MDKLDELGLEIAKALDGAQDAIRIAQKTLGRPTRQDRVDGLAALVEAQEALSQALDSTVARCRFLADPWDMIGAGTGMTRQSAHKRWKDNPGDEAARAERSWSAPSR